MSEEKTFEEIFEELAKTNDRSIIWNNWLDYAIEVNLLKLENTDKKFLKDYQGNEKSYWDMTQAWLNALSVKLETQPYHDILGEFYEELIQSKSKASSLGQAYTPPSVTNLLAEIAFDENKDYTNMIANDPAGGSGRTLLAAHVKSKGKIFCISSDIDETSCRMCVLNFFSMGVRGSVLHMDTLTGEFYKGWRINRYLYHGINIPHIEFINNPDEAYDFIELNNLKNEPKIVNVHDDDSDNDLLNKDTVAQSTIKSSGQTTLI